MPKKTFGGFFFGQRLEKLGYFLILHPVALMTYLFYPFQFALSYSLSRLPKKLTSQNFFPHIWRKKVHTPSLTHPLTHPPTHTHPLTHPQLAFKPFFIPPTFFLAFKPFLLFYFRFQGHCQSSSLHSFFIRLQILWTEFLTTKHITTKAKNKAWKIFSKLPWRRWGRNWKQQFKKRFWKIVD